MMDYLFGGVSWTLVGIIVVIAVVMNVFNWCKEKMAEKEDERKKP